MKELLYRVYFNNSISEYLWSLGTFLVGILVILIIKHFVLKRMRAWSLKRNGSSDNILIQSINKYLLPLMFLGFFYVSIHMLYINPFLNKTIFIISLAVITILIAKIVSSFLEYFFQRYSEKISSDTNKQFAIHWINQISKGIIWAIAGILFLQNIGVEINALVAGLGIGGVAIAFAAQAILEDVFSYFTIFFDRPFEIGDFIISGDHMGTVENIGIKTTRLRSIGGEQLIFSNKDLTNSRVRNYKRMEQRRVLFTLGVTYDTTLEQLKKIPELIKNMVESQPETRFDRAHFFAYAASSLNFEVVYYVLSSEYNKYMDIQQEINFKIKEEFDELGIEFAFPTQTVHMHSSTLLMD